MWLKYLLCGCGTCANKRSSKPLGSQRWHRRLRLPAVDRVTSSRRSARQNGQAGKWTSRAKGEKKKIRNKIVDEAENIDHGDIYETKVQISVSSLKYDTDKLLYLVTSSRTRLPLARLTYPCVCYVLPSEAKGVNDL